jgi:hypothetical protein
MNHPGRVRESPIGGGKRVSDEPVGKGLRYAYGLASRPSGGGVLMGLILGGTSGQTSEEKRQICALADSC